MKKVLILGAGLVAKPMVDYLLSQNFLVILATRTVTKAEKILGNRKNGKAVHLLMQDEVKLDQLISNSDIVVSLLPYTYHVKVAQFCLKHKKSLVTTSYVSHEMQNLDDQAKERGILILNEIGLDPGIDHMSAMRIIEDIHSRNGKIISFRSYCGGIPAPENNDNPWGYKFSWSPKGVLMAGRNNARFLSEGKIVEISGKELFKNHWPITIEDLELETYPNRDSIPYIQRYGIHEAQTMFRGTLRYPGWCQTLSVVSELGLLEETPVTDVKGKTYCEILNRILKVPQGEDPKKYISKKLHLEEKDEILHKFSWLGLFDKEVFPEETTTPIDFLAYLMLKKMQYSQDERDMIVLHHDFVVEFSNQKEHILSTLIETGAIRNKSAMSRTVSLPAAIAVRLILEGAIKEIGVQIPIHPDIYHPVLTELEDMGLIFREKKEKLKHLNSSDKTN